GPRRGKYGVVKEGDVEGRGKRGDRLGRDLALAHGAVGQHRLAGGVADGEDPRLDRRTAGVDLDEAAGVLFRARRLEPDALGERPAADGDQHAVERRRGTADRRLPGAGPRAHGLEWRV